MNKAEGGGGRGEGGVGLIRGSAERIGGLIRGSAERIGGVSRGELKC